MGDITKFPIRSVLKKLQIGETVDFPCGRRVETHRPSGDRRGSIRSAAANLKKCEGLRFSVNVESDRTRVTRLEDDPDFAGLNRYIERDNAERESIRGRVIAMNPGDELYFDRRKEMYLRSLTSQLYRTERRRYMVEVQKGGNYVFVECVSVPEKKV